MLSLQSDKVLLTIHSSPKNSPETYLTVLAAIVLAYSNWLLFQSLSNRPIPYKVSPPERPEKPEILEKPSIKVCFDFQCQTGRFDGFLVCHRLTCAQHTGRRLEHDPLLRPRDWRASWLRGAGNTRDD